MGDNTTIEWTDHTFNPWIGCTRVSPGCDFCYAASLAERMKWAAWGRGEPRKIMSNAYWKHPRAWNRKAEETGGHQRVFCASVADVFDAEAPASELPKLWTLIRETPWLDWQLLTKRPNRIRRMLPVDLQGAPNVWLGTSVESTDHLWRIGKLLETPAIVHFLSIEPLLGSIPDLPLSDIEWVILGGESGPHHRPVQPEWVQEVRDHCVRAQVPLFFKQWGGRTPKAGGRVLDGREWSQFPSRARVERSGRRFRRRLVSQGDSPAH